MNQPFILSIFVIVILVLISGLFFITKSIKKRQELKLSSPSMIKMPYSERTEKEAKEIISAFGPPSSLDLVVEHLGKTTEIYITTEKKYFPKLKRLADKITAKEYEIREDDYLVFHHGGFYEVLTGEIEKEEALKIDFKSIDFSKVNEIGEGAAIRMVFASKRKVKISMFFSAPSQFQLREIVERAIQPFKEKGCRVPKNKKEAIIEFNLPDFLYRAAK